MFKKVIAISYIIMVTLIIFCCLAGVCYGQTVKTNVCDDGKEECIVSYKIGDQVRLLAEPSDGYYFAGWRTDVAGCEGTGACEFVIKKNAVVVDAIFEPIATETLHVFAFGLTGGRVTSNPAGIDCLIGAVCSAKFKKMETVVLTAIPPAGKKFAWRISGCSGSGTCSVVMSKAKVCNVRFY